MRDEIAQDLAFRQRQRLVLFLDGTWNNKDDCTNVLNLYNLVQEGEVGGGLVQRKLYDEGVGTGVLDAVSGGAFGDGLEINVREAYDWLVEHFHDGVDADGHYQADEIYVFGFSRGAYTARSLVGFIARCGLLRRGAPLTVGQLWQGYGELERKKQEEGEGLWDLLLNQGKFRQLEELVWDPWRGGALRDAKKLNATERLLVGWSRRVKITFVGVYDTVGAMGLDALAIPGLRGKAGRLHNMRPSSIIGNFRHALAIDENRAGFEHTPLLEYLPHDQKTSPRPGLRQRWFVGSHSNVGGGYEDNGLAQAPLRWMLDEARAVGLVAETPQPRNYYPPSHPVELPAPRDSFAEFAWPFGTHVLRVKRNYRCLVPPDQVRAKRGAATKKRSARLEPGFALHSEEIVDDSVWDYAAANKAYAPPNLIDYATRAAAAAKATSTPLDPRIEEVAGRAVRHRWPSPLGGGYLGLAAWAILAGIGALVVDGMFLLFPGSVGRQDWVAAAVVVIVAVLVDWGESRLGLRLAAGRGAIWQRALVDGIFWTRSIVVVFFVAGALGTLGFLVAVGWNSADGGPGAGGLGKGLGRVAEVAFDGWLLAPLVLLVLALARLLDDQLGPVKPGDEPLRPAGPGWRRRAAGTVAALTGLAAGVVGLVFLGRTVVKIFQQAGWATAAMPALRLDAPDPNAIAAGRYLFLVVALAYLLRSAFWVGEPMARVNLGGGLGLMFRTSGAGVQAVLCRWQKLLERWSNTDVAAREEEARCAVRAAVQEGLWRDILGFVPVYNIVLGYGLYFASSQPGWHWLADPLPLWWMLPLATALADQLENAAFLAFVGQEGPFAPPSDLKVRAVFLATLVKFSGAALAVAASVTALCEVGWGVMLQDTNAGWRGALAATVVLTAIAVIGSSTLAAIKARRAKSPSP